jgi:hypothetical protein
MDNINNLIIFVFVTIFLIVFVIKDISHRFFFVTIITIVSYFYFKTYKKNDSNDKNINTFLLKLEKDLSIQLEIPENKIFFIHKTPTNINAIKKHRNLAQIVYDIKFLQIYDNGLYNKFVSYLEYFLRIHYKIILNKYEVDQYLPILQDIRFELLNILKSAYYNMPSISAIIDIKNLDVFLAERIRLVQAITYKLMKLVSNKYKKKVKPPYDFDYNKDNHYALF